MTKKNRPSPKSSVKSRSSARKRPKQKDSGRPFVTTYKAHRAKWDNCELCELCNVRKRVVLARGFIPCDILLVGEAPGASEDVLGSAFAGPAGHLLDRAINRAMDVEDWTQRGVPIRVGLTNLIACIPKEIIRDEDSPSTFTVGKKIAEPAKQHIDACAERLRELYAIAKPKKVVCVGKLAEKFVPKILDVSIENMSGITHPAAVLRMDVSQKGLEYQRICVQLEDLFDEYLEEQGT